MDAYNVIDITDDLEHLLNDYNKWSMLTFNLRKRADDECIKRHNCTNTDLFNKLRASIISNKNGDDSDEMVITKTDPDTLQEAFDIVIPDLTDNKSEESDDFETKVQVAKDLNLSDDYCILIPGEYKTVEELDNAYMKFINLPASLKRMSDSFSIDLWGYNLYNMYCILKAKLEGKDITGVNVPVSNPVAYRLEQSHSDIDKFMVKLDSCNESIKGLDEAQYKVALENIEPEFHFDKFMKDFVPFFTPGERDVFKNEINSKIFDIMEHSAYDTLTEGNNYEKLIRGLYEDYHKPEVINNPITHARVESTLLALGWNPEVPVNERSIKFAKEKQLKWFNETRPMIIDITNIDEGKSVITESTQKMRRMYEEYNLYPVYIVLSYSGNIYGKAIRFVKKSKYTHAGLSLDSDLQSICTYKIDKYHNGFATDSLDTYIGESESAIISLLTLFVDKATRDKIDMVLRDFVAKQEKSKYNIGNIINILFNKATADDPESVCLVCSQFVDLVLKIANIDLTGKPNNLVIPQDFQNVSNNPKVYKVYEGYGNKYNEKLVEDNIYTLFHKYNNIDIKYSDLMEAANEGFSMKLLDYHVTDNEKANAYIKEMRELLTPQAVIYHVESEE